jgi:hypothetical protein
VLGDAKVTKHVRQRQVVVTRVASS